MTLVTSSYSEVATSLATAVMRTDTTIHTKIYSHLVLTGLTGVPVVVTHEVFIHCLVYAVIHD